MSSEYISISDTAVGLDELVDHRIAAKIIGLAPRTIQNLASARKIPCYKVGSRSNRYLVREIIEWCEARRYDTL